MATLADLPRIAASSVELEQLEQTYRATLNILEDFDEERARLKQFQQATMNLLEDFDQERRRSDEVQRASMNLLEDFDEQRRRSDQMQQATMNVLEDFDRERQRSNDVQRATMNLLEDMNDERNRLAETQRALTNILEDVEAERSGAERARSQLEAANKELEAFSYSVSHDLRAPLRAISGFADAVVEDYAAQLDDEGKRYLGLIAENVGKMGQLIDDLLRFSRLLRQPFTPSEVDLRKLAKTVFEELKVDLRGRDVKFIVGPVPKTRGDEATLKQVLVNLISNALKFTRQEEKAVIEFGFMPDADGGAYYVRDNGVGFDMRFVDKLFGVFQRLHAETEFEGTGVGLAIVQRVIARHGGRVWAEGKLGEGATFFFTLPSREEGEE